MDSAPPRLNSPAAISCLLAQRKFAEILNQSGGENLTAWPFWAAGEGYWIRGRAYAAIGDKAKAAADLKAALGRITEPRVRNKMIELEKKL